MKYLIALLLLLSAGCASINPQRLMDRILPASFKGDVSIDHTNIYFSFTLNVGNLRKGPDGLWEYDWLVLDRRGFSRGVTVLGSPPPLDPRPRVTR